MPPATHLPATDIDDDLRRREVVRGQDSWNLQPGLRAHERLESRHLIRVLRQIFEESHTVCDQTARLWLWQAHYVAGVSQRSRSSRTASMAGRSSSAIWFWL
jgi:hypothetical protein